MDIDIDSSHFVAFLNGIGDAENAPTHDGEVVHDLARSIASGRRTPARLDAVQAVLAEIDLRLFIGLNDGPLRLALSPVNCGARHSALCALLAALAMYQTDSFQLRRCFYDGQWFVPGVRSARSKFCSAKCRNRFNYELREQNASFICSGCNVQYAIDNFSGLALSGGVPELAVVNAVSALCFTCVVHKYPDWHGYIAAADLTASVPDDGPSSAHDHASEVLSAITSVLSRSPQPLHYKQIATAVTEQLKIRGRSPELTVLGYLTRHADKFSSVAAHTFCLNRQYANEITVHAPNAAIVENGTIE